MKTCLLMIIIILAMPLRTSGQTQMDTLYLKNGKIEAGKILEISKTQYSFQNTNGTLFIIPADDVEKVIPFIDSTSYTTIRKILNVDTVTISDLNHYYNQGVRTRNAGMVMTLGGVGVALIGTILLKNYTNGDMVMALGGITVLAGACSTAIGIPLWASGKGKMKKVELPLQKLNIASEKPIALGVGITFIF